MKVVTKITKDEFTKSVELAKSNPANQMRFQPVKSKYVMIGGIPYKFVNGELVQLTKVV